LVDSWISNKEHGLNKKWTSKCGKEIVGGYHNFYSGTRISKKFVGLPSEHYGLVLTFTLYLIDKWND